MMQQTSQHGAVTIVVMGDNNVGKTSLCYIFYWSVPKFVYTMECNRLPHEKDITVGSETVHIKCIDTEGHEDYNDTQPESYQDADVFVLCFSLSGANSFNNINAKWLFELKQYAPKVPFLLVGCKEDTR